MTYSNIIKQNNYLSGVVEVAWQTTIPVFASGILVLSRKQKEETRMYGAILGDMIGSPYEFDQGKKTKDFPMFVY